MGKITGFLEFDRKDETYAPVKERIKNYKEFTKPLKESELKNQGARCMDCGIPFCHSGCPLGNLIPDFNDAVYKGKWEKAAEILHSTNNFPEFTGRLCPAPCEEACVLGINEDPVTGSAHTTLIPYWSKKLDKSILIANQVSQRGGELFCSSSDDRVLIGGNAVLYMKGTIEIN